MLRALLLLLLWQTEFNVNSVCVIIMSYTHGACSYRCVSIILNVWWLFKFTIRSKTVAQCCQIVSVAIIIVTVMLLLCCAVIYTWIPEYSFIIFILIYILIFLVLCWYIHCIYSYKLWNILTLLLTVILSHIHISPMFCHYISCIYSYRLWNILTVLLTVILLNMPCCSNIILLKTLFIINVPICIQYTHLFFVKI